MRMPPFVKDPFSPMKGIKRKQTIINGHQRAKNNAKHHKLTQTNG